MPKLDSTRYTVLFAAAISVACALVVAASAVGLRERQQTNALLYQQKNVLLAAGLIDPEEDLSRQEILDSFERNIRVRVIDLKSGELVPEDKFDAKTYDQRKARKDPALSFKAPDNPAGVARLPNYATVYQVVKAQGLEQVVVPIEGMGMWGTMYGFLALDRDGNTVRGLTFYEQKETPGLGAEIASPQWQALWVGRQAYDPNWVPKLGVIKGPAGPPEKSPHEVDGIAGATITSNGVTRVVRFWLSDDGYAPFLAKMRNGVES